MLACGNLKTCSCCRIELSLNMFHKNRTKKDGLHDQCRVCKALDRNKKKNRIAVRKHYKKHPVTNRIKKRIWLEKHPGYKNKVNEKYRKRHRKQANAEQMARYHLRKGRIERKGFCEKCGSSNPEMHHEDYNKPLEVTWLCKRCHGRQHRKTG